MTFSNLLSVLKAKYHIFLSCMLLGMFIGIVSYIIIPQTYTATGSFYLDSPIEQKTDFTYEGFYAQQASLNLSNTLADYLTTSDVRYEVLKATNENTSYLFLKLNTSVDKNPNSQLITLSYTSSSPKMSVAVWNAYISNLENFVSKISSNVSLIYLSDTPTIEEGFRYLPFNIFSGSILGAIFGLILIFFREVKFND
jgi:capsular polysaccharide biosynthesis protein